MRRLEGEKERWRKDEEKIEPSDSINQQSIINNLQSTINNRQSKTRTLSISKRRQSSTTKKTRKTRIFNFTPFNFRCCGTHLGI